jgi:methionyl-tRNA formyltransferase
MPNICIAGKNDIAVYGLRLAISMFGKENVTVCPNSTDHGKTTWQPSLRRYAKEFGVRMLNLSEAQNAENIIFLSLEFDQIIDPNKFRSKKLYNIHFSLLPAYKGVYTSAWPILNGEKKSGVTLHRIDSGIDTGEIISQISFDLSGSETARSLYIKYMSHSKELLNDYLLKLSKENFSSYPQSSSGSSYFSKKSIDYSNLKINLWATAESVSRQVRAFSFREFQTPHILGIPVCNPQILDERSFKKAGAIELIDDNLLEIDTIDYKLRLSRDRSYDIHAAVSQGDAKTLHQLCFDGLAIEGINFFNSSGWTPLMRAVFLGNMEMVKVLLRFGANVNLGNPNGTTALMYAKDYGETTGDFSVATILLDAGANVTLKDNFEKNIYDYINLKQQLTSINFFRKHDANI